jgi:hypothetical protein
MSSAQPDIDKIVSAGHGAAHGVLSTPGAHLKGGRVHMMFCITALYCGIVLRHLCAWGIAYCVMLMVRTLQHGGAAASA